jgi:LysM repeat protein
MNTPNPLMPHGSMKELSKGKSHVRIAVLTILGIHVVVIAGLLIAGCKKEGETAQNTGSTTLTNPAPSLVPPDVTSTPPATAATPISQAPPVANLAPAPPPHETPAVSTETTEYTVAKGDTFSSIATKLGVSVKALVAANPNVDPKKLMPNQKIQVPAKSKDAQVASSATSGPSGAGSDNIYVVKPSDNLTKIARAYGTTPKAIRAANNLKTDQIRAGQKLKLPVKAASGTNASAEPIPAGAGAP